MMGRILMLGVLAAACAGNTGGDVGRVQASLLGASGQMGSTVMIAPKLGVTEIIVTVDKVTAHSSEAGWVTLSGTEKTIDVLQLAKYGTDLGFANVPAGKITQLRLYVKEGGTQYVTRDDGVRVDLKVPSGIESGIKLHGLFDISGCQTTNVPLELDGKRSIWVHDTGQELEWILRPVIRTGHATGSDMGCTPGGEIPGDGDGTPGGTGGGSGTTGGTGGGTGTIGEGPGSGGMGGAGATCSTGTNCLSGSCVASVCAAGGPDAPCAAATDCASGVCTAGVCGPGNATGAGVPCTLGSQCLSNACVNGVCEPGGQGQPCASAADCLSGYSCSAGACQPPIN